MLTSAHTTRTNNYQVSIHVHVSASTAEPRGLTRSGGRWMDG